jgi:hypothetical protein
MNATMKTNPLLDRLPKHLKQFIKPQDYIRAHQAVMALCDAKRELPFESGTQFLSRGLKKTG